MGLNSTGAIQEENIREFEDIAITSKTEIQAEKKYNKYKNRAIDTSGIYQVV